MNTKGQKYTESYIKVGGTLRDDGLYTIPDCIKYYADNLGDNEAIVFADYKGGRQAVSWTEIYEKCTALARSLIRLGVKKGELVAINVRSCPEWIYFVFGAIFAGAVPVSISFTYRDGSDLIAIFDKLSTCCLLALDPGVDGLNWEIVENLLDIYSPEGHASSRKLQGLRYFIGHQVDGKMPKVKTIEDLVREKNALVELPTLGRHDMAFLVQTSGSTGVPKLVTHTHKSCLIVRQMTDSGFLDSSVILYNDRPFTWIGGFPLSVLVGQKRVTVSGFCHPPKNRMASVLDIVQRERCTLLVALPPMIHAFIHSQTELPDNWPVKSLLTGGQPVTKSITAAIGKVASYISVAYGGTEFQLFSSAEESNGENFKEYYCGKVANVPGIEMKVVDENGKIVPVNTRGELYIRSPGMFKEYYNDPVKTAAVLSPDSWYKTDDIGMMTENAEIFVYGRKSNMIISGGMNVSPEILEHAMKSCPGVATVAIVPVPDDVYYQVLCACVIREKGSDVTEEQIRKFCEVIHNDAPGMFTVLPKYYIFLEKFPETTTGKTNRLELVKLATKTFTYNTPRDR